MSFKAKIFRFVNRLVNIEGDKRTDVIKYGKGNSFPNELIRELDESKIATRCIEAIAQYTYANGFVDEASAKFQINKQQTGNELLKENSFVVGYFQGVTFSIIRDLSGNVLEMKSIPFETVRKTKEGCFIINPTFGTTKVDTKKDRKCPAFMGAFITADQLSKRVLKFGADAPEILYYFIRKPGKSIYPIPSFYSAIEDINTDSEISKFNLETVNNSFLPSSILTLIGDIDDQAKDDNGRTEWDYYQDTLEAFTGGRKDKEGETGRMKLAVFHAKTKEEIPVLQQFDVEKIMNSAINFGKTNSESVCMAFGVPAFILGVGGSVGFATQIISDNITLFNNNVYVLKSIISDAIKLCFPNMNWEITCLDPIKFIPDIILNELTTAEKRAIAGYSTDETKSTSSVTLAQTLGVGGTQSLISTLQDAILSPDQKINILIALFGLDEPTARKLVQPTQPVVALNEDSFMNLFYDAAPSKSEISQAFNDYFSAVNMSYTNYINWLDSDHSKIVGTHKQAKDRTKHLLNINKGDWGVKEYRWSKQLVSLINRVGDFEDGDPVSGSYSMKAIRLKNLGVS